MPPKPPAALLPAAVLLPMLFTSSMARPFRGAPPRSSGLRSARLHEHRPDEAVDELALLVGAGIAREDQAPAGARGALALRSEARREGNRVARIDGPVPDEIPEAG